MAKQQVNGVHHTNGTSTNGETPSTRHRPNGLAVRPGPLERKPSTPMMPPFMTSAPGKVIVFGEHAVVHGKAAMAASVSLRSYLLVTGLTKSQRTVTLRFPDIGLAHTWKIDELPWATFHAPGKKKFYYDLVTSLDDDLVNAIQPLVHEVSLDEPPDTRKVHQASASAFLYLFLSLGNPSFPGSVYTLRSTIPVGSGLGSSASVAVCLSSALLKQLHALSGPHPDQPPEEAELQVERINRWAFVAEMCIHGTPSGVDNTVAARGKAVVFQRKDYSAPPSTLMLNDFPELPLLLVNTQHPKNTGAEVAKVHALRDSQPVVTEAVFDAIDKVTQSAAALVRHGHHSIKSNNSDDDDDTDDGHSSNSTFDPQDGDAVRALGELFQLNHGLLGALGVSHPTLERIKDIVADSGLGWTKLTGAGGGGFAITLLRPGCAKADVAALEARLEAEGFRLFDTLLGGDGVGILWPAVLHNGNNPYDDEYGEEIDQDKFLEADGPEELDRLVGVGVRKKREDWKYWR